jgi:HK97 family phage portal protein
MLKLPFGLAIAKKSNVLTMPVSDYLKNPQYFDMLGGQGKLSNEALYSNVWNVYRCIYLIASNIANFPVNLYRGDTELEGVRQIDIFKHSANVNQSGQDFIEAMISYLLISGDAYSYISAIGDPRKSPIEVFYLKSNCIELLPGATFSDPIKGYRDSEQGRILSLDEVCHIKFFNPSDRFRGVSPLSVSREIATAQSLATTWQASLLRNTGMKNGYLTTLQPLSVPQMQQIAKDRDEMAGAMMAGKVPIFPSGLDFKSMQLSPVDMNILNSQAVNTQQIADVFGVPIELLNSSQGVTYENKRQALKIFIKTSCIPLANKFYSAWARYFWPTEYDYNYEIDRDDIPELETSITDTTAPLAAATWLTPNEKREYQGYDAIPDPAMDKCYFPAGQLPVDMIGVPPQDVEL